MGSGQGSNSPPDDDWFGLLDDSPGTSPAKTPARPEGPAQNVKITPVAGSNPFSAQTQSPNDDLWDWEIDPKPPVKAAPPKNTAPTVMSPPDPFDDGEEIDLADLSEDPFAHHRRDRDMLDTDRPSPNPRRTPLSEVEEVNAQDFNDTENWQFDPIAAAPPLPQFPASTARFVPPIVPTVHGPRTAPSAPSVPIVPSVPNVPSAPSAAAPLVPPAPLPPPELPPVLPPSSASSIRGGTSSRGPIPRFKATQAFTLPVPVIAPPSTPPAASPHPSEASGSAQDSPTVRPVAMDAPRLPPESFTRADTPPHPVLASAQPESSPAEVGASVPHPTPRPPPPATFTDPADVHPEPKAQDRWVEMRERFEAGDFASALLLSESLLQANPKDLEARRVSDTSRQKLRSIYSGRLGNLQQIPRVIVPYSELRWLTLDHRAGFVLSLIDGSLTLEDILDVSAMPALEVLRTLYNLSVQRVIELRPPRR